jgi:tetratricopeptide (TPR) repeat protein
MSLLADLLSKVKHGKREGGIPPTLEKVILDEKKKRNVKKQIIILAGLALFMVLAGLGVVYYTNVVMEPSFKSRSVRTNIQPALQPQKIESKQPETAGRIDEKQVGSSIETLTGKVEKKTYKKPAMADPVKPLQREAAAPSGKSEYLHAQAMVKHKEETSKISSELTISKKAERDGFLYTAKNYEAEKDYQQALDYYKKALEIDFRNYAIMNNISSIFIKTGSYEEAIKYSQDVLNINKNYVPSIVNIGISFVQTGNNDKGKAYLLKAVSLEPSNKIVLLNLALLYEKDKEYEEAHKLYSRLYQMEDLRGYMGIARIAENTDRIHDAKRVYREILTLKNVDAKTKKIVSERLSNLENR